MAVNVTEKLAETDLAIATLREAGFPVPEEATELREIMFRCVEAESKLKSASDDMGMKQFARRNRRRCEAASGFAHSLDSWSLSDWMTATVGELGEAANVLKKLNRVRDGIPGNDRTPERLRHDFADELADTFIYLDLLAQAAGIELADAVTRKFEITSAKIGYVES